MRPRPGDRRRRWNLGCSLEITQHLTLALLFGFGINGVVGFGLSAICLLMAIHSCFELKNGWKMSDKRPPWADRHDAIDNRLREKLRGAK